MQSKEYKTNIPRQTNSDRRKQESTAQEKHMSETTEVDIVYASLRSGSLVPTRVMLPRNTPGISDVEEGNGESSRRLRKEAKEIYAEIFSQRQANGEDIKEAKENRHKNETKLKERSGAGRRTTQKYNESPRNLQRRKRGSTERIRQENPQPVMRERE